MEPVIAIQHVGCETLGIIADVLKAGGVSTRLIRPWEGEPLPKETGASVGLILMGGPMGVNDHNRYPFLLDEMALIEEALYIEKPVLGICLGSQLLAAALGATVTKGKRKELGWHPIMLTPSAADDPLWKEVEPSFMGYHWHGDIFALPRGAVSLASSDLTECQAFRCRHNAYGFLFHLEVTRKIIEEMVKTFADELQDAGVEGSEIIEKAKDHLPPVQSIGRTVFHRWVDLVKRSD